MNDCWYCLPDVPYRHINCNITIICCRNNCIIRDAELMCNVPEYDIQTDIHNIVLGETVVVSIKVMYL